MPLIESNELAGYYPSDEHAIVRLRGEHLPVTHTQRAIDKLTEQLHRTMRANAVLEEQLKSTQADERKWRGKYENLCEQLRRQRERECQAPITQPREPRSYAERMRMKRF